MIHGDSLNLKLAATSEDGKEIPFPKKPDITLESQIDVIEYQGRLFEVPIELIFYVANQPKILHSRIERTLKNGMGFMYPDGGTGCHYCNYYSKNVAALMSENPEMTVHNREGTPSTGVKGCIYKGDKNIKQTTVFQSKDTGVKVMAQTMPCVIYESMAAELVERGLFDDFEIQGKSFDFPTIAELSTNPEVEQKYNLANIKLEPIKLEVVNQIIDSYESKRKVEEAPQTKKKHTLWDRIKKGFH